MLIYLDIEMIVTILIFLIILGLIVFVHELGHFVMAKRNGMKVEEFGFGFPPRMFGIQVLKENKIIGSARTETVTASETDIRTVGGEVVIEKITDTVKEVQEVVPRKKWHLIWGHKPPLDPEQTVYSINWIPLGGFVRILGENNEHEEDPRSFINRPFKARLVTLVAGVSMNLLLAWFLITIGFMVGLPAAVDNLQDIPANGRFINPKIAVVEVAKNLPADKAGIKTGDLVLKVDNREFGKVEDMRNYILSKAGSEFNFQINRANKTLEVKVQSDASPKPGEGPTGIALAYLGKLRFPAYLAVWEGTKTTGLEIVSIGQGLYQLVTAQLSLSNLGGPVKIAQLTGQAADMGFTYLLQFTSFLSLNLAILNILPFPALDGGRVFFLIIEKIRRKRNNPKIEQIINTAGFVFLILLMLFVTIKDVKGF